MLVCLMGQGAEVHNLLSCRYLFQSGETNFAISVGAIKGKLYVAGASAPKSEWDQVQASLQDAVNSFRLATPQT